MFIRIVRGRIDPARLDEVAKLGPELSAAIRRQPGYQSATGGVDRASGRTVTVSTWDTEAHARYSPEVLGDIVTRMQQTGLQVEPAEVYEAVSTGG
jgi:quinol monooxygenase YgiN